jgi:hypothetical protein
LYQAGEQHNLASFSALMKLILKRYLGKYVLMGPFNASWAFSGNWLKAYLSSIN